MLLLLALLLVQWRAIACVTSPSFDDNMVAADEEGFSDSINFYRGQPEQEITLNLPTDEDALNEIKPMLQYGNPFYNTDSLGRLIPFSFPEIDSRGFHESVFDDLDDLYAVSRRGKRYDSSTSSNSGTSMDEFDLPYPNHKFFRYDENMVPSYHSRRKRWSQPESHAASKKNPIHNAPLTIRDESNNHSPNSLPHLHDDSSNHSMIRGLETKQNLQKDTAVEIRQKRATPQGNVPYARQKRNSQISANGFHGDVLNNFNDVETQQERVAGLKATSSAEIDSDDDFDGNFFGGAQQVDVMDKRVPEMDKGGFHNDVFHNNFGNFHTLKRAPEMGQSGFHGDIFHKSFGDFNTLKRAPEMSQAGFHNDVFHNNFGHFETLRKRKPAVDVKNFNHDAFNRDFGHFDTLRKRKPAGGSSARDDLFSPDIGFVDRDFGNFYAGKRRPKAGAVNGDAFHSNFGIFETLKKRRPEGELMGDAFHRSFGNFNTMKRTLAGDAFHSQFGKFETMKRRPNAEANLFANDNFQDQFGNFNTLKRSMPRSLNDYVEILSKVRPHRFDKLRFYPEARPQDKMNFEKFRMLFQNYALQNRFEDMAKRFRTNDTSAPVLKFVKHNSSFTH